MEMKAIYDAALRDKEAVARFLQDLIRIKSLSTEEKAVVERIAEEMRKVGFDEVKIDGLGNVIGRVGNGPRRIAMDAHIDTVDVGNPELWEIDPFAAILKDDIIYGRGACDMKGAMASLVYGAKLIKELGLAKDLSIFVTGTVMEEDCDGLCWQYILKEKVIDPWPECVVIAEPTNMNIYRGHRGRMEIEVSVTGLSAHGSAPERGINAVYKMAPIVLDIEKLNECLRHDPFLGKGTVTISEIRSTSPSLCAVADSCTIHLDRRLTKGETIESAVAEIEALPSVQAAKAKVTVLDYARPAYTGLVYPTKKYYPTWVLEEDHPALKAAVSAYEKVLGQKPKVDKWTFSTNGVATMGMFGIPSFGLGPGNEEFAHSPKEHIPVEHLWKAAAFYAAFAETYANQK
ncbi:MAG: YgeY family selenium metabolism-linked hydrolase [Candidatus Hydrogenedentota bacterium]|uniref:Acetylornithine deacetylase n=1 Tax=Sumerlaea chitinivorans TaxID=2250252 RepID=A0A2Z4Y8D8_SUMC1|nr:Acetylornithine deacetylase [Candidatus Sumerlaea chitinivorans]RMH23981.1 MAG: YgeY family selenium metabolism-linked hydrolase [Candidatus Hydrogenedentota bacterium]GIX43618.1 MAG: peptidase [Candidatus Sumerlaea sp.]